MAIWGRLAWGVLSDIEAPIPVRRSESSLAVHRRVCRGASRDGRRIPLPRFEHNHCRVGGVHDTVGCMGDVESNSLPTEYRTYLELIQKGGEATFSHGRIFEDLTEAQEDFERRRRRL